MRRIAELVWVGRMATVAMTVIALIWIPVIRNAPRGLYDYLQGIQGYLAPPIFVVFFLGVFWKRLNAAGLPGGALRRLPDGPVPAGRRYADHAGSEWLRRNGYTHGSFLWIVNNIYFQYYSLLIFLVSVVAMIIVSYVTAPPSEEQISGLTFSTTTEEQKAESRASWSGIDVVTSVIVMVAIVAAYLYFRG